MTPDKECPHYPDICEFRGTTNTRLDSLENRMDKIDTAIKEVKEDIHANGNKLTKIFAYAGAAALIIVPILSALVNRLFNGSH